MLQAPQGLVDKESNAEPQQLSKDSQMYATATDSSANVYRAQAMSSVYRQIGVETGLTNASPHAMVAMLFNGSLDAIAQARGAIQTGNIETKCKAINKAIQIVQEGLNASLNIEHGGELAQRLNQLYAYITNRLMLANLKSDDAILEECSRLLTPLRDAWVAIGNNTSQGGLMKKEVYA
jgi:flagellar secretion chaperone FliS